jgi:hypothetical protein
LATLVVELDGPLVLLMTWLMVPVPPRETSTMLVKRTFGSFGASMAWSAVTLGLMLKEQ